MFEEWKTRYDRMIYHLLHQYHITYDFDEYYQLALIKLWEIHESFDPTRTAHQDQFVYMKLKFSIIDELRKRIKYKERYHPVTDEVLIPLLDCTEEPVAFLIEELAVSLTDNELLWLKYALLGYNIEEIAGMSDRSPSAVKRWRKCAREKLRLNDSFTFKSVQ
ncbi:sigma factor [Macrococcus equipercicus]|nr:sigma factor [Macrococcus equipercicus]